MRIRSLIGVVTSLPLLLMLGVAPAASETGLTEAGRSARTGPKHTQSQLDEIPLDAPPVPSALIPSRAAADRESGRTIRGGRQLEARPTEAVSVGIVGCPGCTILLEALGGVFIEGDASRSRRHR